MLIFPSTRSRKCTFFTAGDDSISLHPKEVLTKPLSTSSLLTFPLPAMHSVWLTSIVLIQLKPGRWSCTRDRVFILFSVFLRFFLYYFMCPSFPSSFLLPCYSSYATRPKYKWKKRPKQTNNEWIKCSKNINTLRLGRSSSPFACNFAYVSSWDLLANRNEKEKKVDKQTIRWLLPTCKFSSPFPNNKCLLGLSCKMVVYYLHQEPRARQWARMRNHGLCKNCNRIQQNLLFMHPPPPPFAHLSHAT